MAAKKETREVMIARDPSSHEEDTMKVAVNGKLYQVPLGVPVQVPLPVYEVIMHSQAAKMRSDAYVRDLEDKAKKAGAALGLG